MTAQESLAGQVALVTGAGSGLGAAFARRLADDGATVIVTDIAAEAATAVAVEIGGDVGVFDVCDPVAFDTEVDKAVQRHGRLDIVINNAGIAPPGSPERTQLAVANQMLRMEGRLDEMTPPNSFAALTDAEWDRMIRVHLYGTFHGTRAALRHMTPARRGCVVNVSSVLGLRPMAGVAHYAAAKAGIIALTKSAGQEVAPFGVRVNAVCPGWIDTPLLAPLDPITRGAITSQIPRGRMGTAAEIAELVRFLCGEESSYCNGDVFAASGGVI